MISTLQRYAILALGVLAVALVIGCCFLAARSRISDLRADAAEQRAADSEGRAAALTQARDAEHAKAEQIAAIANQYEQDKRDADEAQKHLVGDLRAGAVKLQDRWRGCVSDAAATAAERDAAAADRDASAARVVRAARDADDQIRALQAIVKADRK